MRVTGVEIFLVGREWNNLVIARVRTDKGVSGLGEGTMQWQARTVATAIEHMASRYVIGSSPFDIERLVQAMYRNEYARGGPILNSAIAAIEFALWDICGKAVGQPVYNLLGGKVHDSIPAYANGWCDAGTGSGDIAAAARKVVASGYRGLKFDPFWGLGRDPDLADIRRGIEKVAAVRAAVGSDIKIMIDAHGRFSVGTASSVAHALAENAVYWLEEPVDPENFAALGEVARPGGLRIAAGERCYSRYAVPLLLNLGRPHVLQPDPIQVGGLLEAKKIAALADSSYLPVSFHCPFGPIAAAAILQLNAATTNIVSQESFSEFDVGWRSELVSHCPLPVGGSYTVNALPGLGGIELNESVVREHPYRERAVQSMWAVNGSMLGPDANVTAACGEEPPASSQTNGPTSPKHEEEKHYEDANEA